MRLNTVSICADALIGVLSGTDALVDRQEKIAVSAENADRDIGECVRGCIEDVVWNDYARRGHMAGDRRGRAVKRRAARTLQGAYPRGGND